MGPTDREQQILSWIRQNPMISQNELAELCGITRSGVAAHISNLMKKGLLQGKGYIVTPPQYVVEVGGVNMDVFGRADKPMVGGSSNVGRITYSLGGIARNVAFNLGKLGVRNYLITVYGDDHNGERVKQDALDNGIDITYAKQLAHTNTSTYLSLSGPDGNQTVGLDDMSISDFITEDFLSARAHVIDHARFVVIDSSLSQQAISWMYAHCDGPIFARVVSVDKAQRLLPGIERLDTIVLSAPETEVLSGVAARDEVSADACASRLLERGVGNVFVLVDGVGMLYRNADERCFFEMRDMPVKYMNGAASAALSALVWARGENRGFVESAELANAAAYISMERVESVNPALNVDAVERRRKALFGPLCL